MQSDYERIAELDTELLFINPEDLDQTRDFVAKSKVTREALSFPVLADPDRAIPTKFKIQKATDKGTEVIPTAFIIDKEGVLRFKYVGSDPFDRPSTENLVEILAMISG